MKWGQKSNLVKNSEKVDIQRKEQIMSSVSKSNATAKKQEVLEILLKNPRISLSLDDTLILDYIDTKIKVVKFLDNIFKSKAIISNLYLTLLDVLKLPPHLVYNYHAKQENRGDWLPFGR